MDNQETSNGASIFEKIIAREIPATIVYEDEIIIAFLDIRPINKGHVLIVPKKHFRNILDGDEAVLAHMMRTAKKIAQAVMTAMKADGVNVTMNNEPSAGQEVFHAHLHVIPRFTDDGVFKTMRNGDYETGEMERVGKDILDALQESGS